MTTVDRRGQPLVAIVSLLVGYSVLRTAFWTPLLQAIPHPIVDAIETLIEAAAPAQALAASGRANPRTEKTGPRAGFGPGKRNGPARLVALVARTNSAPSSVRDGLDSSRMELASMAGQPQTIDRASAFAFVSQEGFAGSPSGPMPPYSLAPSRPRFSGDAWLFAREGGTQSDLVAPALANYGSSQAGAVLRYALVPDSHIQPELYGRVVAALGGSAQQDAALGISARPLHDVPLRLHAEARATRQGGEAGGETFVRPSVFATMGVYSENPRTQVTTRGYAQAGYVGGRGATAFADGQIVAERSLTRFDLGEVAVGAGAWGGVQRGAGRLDIGPSASVTFRLGEASARLSADYRFRIAGNAQPGSGAAVTLSTGF